VLIEADGSRMRPFKAPAEHEPVIPARTSLVVPVVGADVFGAALGPERVHRFERVEALAGWTPAAPVTPELVARVLAHPEGGLKNVPPSARVIPLVNKVETAAALDQARETASRLLAEPRMTAVAIGAARQESPVLEVWGRVGAVVLAAGRATRMGRVKQMLPWRQGETLLTEVVRRLQASPVAQIVVVTGMARDEVEAALGRLQSQPGRPEVRTVFNADYATTEMGRSLQVGLRALPANCGAALVALADQPALEPAVVASVVQRWRESLSPVVAPFYRGRRGHPLLFDRAAWPRLLELPGNSNPREALEAAGSLEAVEVNSDTILRDIDTPEDYDRERAVRGGTDDVGAA
jgi:molybdenum cofactor cytidylyltransferase